MDIKKSKEIIDILFVLNSDSNLLQVFELLNLKKCNNILVLTTHKMYENEIEYFKILGDYKFIFYTFSDFLNDTIMETIDYMALQHIGRHLFDFRLYMDQIVKYKNKEVIDQINKKYDINSVISDDGLGIDYNVFASQYQTIPVEYFGKRKCINFKKNIIIKIIEKINSILTNKLEINIFEFKNMKYIFYGNIGRLKLRSIKSFQKFVNIMYLSYLGIKKSTTICTTIHEYNRRLFKYFERIYVFTDGFFPSNYPESYLNMFDDNVVFVPDTFVNKKWFRLFGRATRPIFNFQRKVLFKKVETESITSVLLVLNHAGDWTSFINRSDTDLLVSAFGNLAKKFSSMKFTIRPHPTMIHSEHEGINSINRITEYVKYLNLKNLKISKSSLQDDLFNNDLIVGEYSNVLVQGFEIGKLGLIVNLTNRRNFMKDFSELGFLTVENLQLLVAFFEEISDDLFLKIKKQNLAVEKFNKLQKQFLGIRDEANS